MLPIFTVGINCPTLFWAKIQRDRRCCSEARSLGQGLLRQTTQVNTNMPILEKTLLLSLYTFQFAVAKRKKNDEEPLVFCVPGSDGFHDRAAVERAGAEYRQPRVSQRSRAAASWLVRTSVRACSQLSHKQPRYV